MAFIFLSCQLSGSRAAARCFPRAPIAWTSPIQLVALCAETAHPHASNIAYHSRCRDGKDAASELLLSHSTIPQISLPPSSSPRMAPRRIWPHNRLQHPPPAHPNRLPHRLLLCRHRLQNLVQPRGRLSQPEADPRPTRALGRPYRHPSLRPDFVARTVRGPSRVLASGPTGIIGDLRRGVASCN